MNRKKPRTPKSQSDNCQIPERFHPELRAWFEARYTSPTEIQQRAWPIVAKGEHSLITAPTGSGKTLTAFLWALNQLLTETWPCGATQVLYISPLKALNNDIQRNLIEPLKELQEHFEQRQLPFPEIRVQTRSGDTPASERQRMVRKPPEILITTPESLNLLLSSKSACHTLGQVKTVILDEIHALVESKRGVYLMSAVERLALSAGEFQRIALSATVNPLECVAKFVGGHEIKGPIESPNYSPRSIQLVESKIKKTYQLKSCHPPEAADAPPEETIWVPVAKECKRRIARNRSTLIFTNNRALCEKITLLINAGEPELIAYAHHGSLSREIRLDVEQRLKEGQLKAIVATNSLELGIDIGDLDEVLLIQCPASVASTLQRLGRAGHRIGEVSKGCLITTHPRDFLESAAMLEAVDERAIEASKLIQAPLDILPQIIVSMIATASWTRTTLYNAIRACQAYRELKVSHFDLVLNMMLGKFAQSRIHELRPLIGIDSSSGLLSLRQGTLMRFYLNTGVIPNRGYYHLRHSDSQARIGELDEEYVWEASLGQTLTLGTQHWKIDRITHNDVFVSPAHPKAPGIPFWRADDINRSFHFSERISQYLEHADSLADSIDFEDQLAKKSRIDKTTRIALAEHLIAQKRHTEKNLPHRHHLLVEITSTGPGSVPGNQVIIHTFWGGKVNRPYALALAAAWNKRHDHPIEIHPSNDCIALVLPVDIEAEALLNLVTSDTVEALLRDQLEASGFFAARFRECAGRALLITKRKFNERLPLWMSRLRSQKLFEAVAAFPDFPITLETWRSCLHDEFDLPNLIARLVELESGEIQWSQVKTHQPSPMARSVAWRQVNDYLYRPDAPGKSKTTSSLDERLVQELLSNESQRPQIPSEIISEFERKRKRLMRGYTPDSSNELIEWLKERLIIPEPEWIELLAAIERDHGMSPSALLEPIQQHVLRRTHPNIAENLIFSSSLLTPLEATFWKTQPGQYERMTSPNQWAFIPQIAQKEPENGTEKTEAETLLLDWIRFSGPIALTTLEESLGIKSQHLEDRLALLTADEQLISGPLELDNDSILYCAPENLEILLRMKRRAARPSFEALPREQLQTFLAAHQGIINKAAHRDGALTEQLNQLLLYPAPCSLWESEILPARLANQPTKLLDLELEDSQIFWAGTGKEEIQFAYADEWHLASTNENDPSRAHEFFPQLDKKYTFSELLENHNLPPSDLSHRLWDLTWNGLVSNDRFATLRLGIANKFKIPSLSGTASNRRSRLTSRPSRSTLSKWHGARPASGCWFRIPATETTDAGIEHEEIKKDRVRLLIDRYGILFRELLWKESHDFSWKALFRTLRLMELSGELITGYFFQGIPGPQFTTQTTVQRLRKKLPTEAVYWINAADPISLCGNPVQDLRKGFPKRVSSNHLVFSDDTLIILSERAGKKLTINLPPDSPKLPEAFGFLQHLLTRSFQPLARITIETINGELAPNSNYIELLRSQFELVMEPSRLSLYRPIPS